MRHSGAVGTGPVSGATRAPRGGAPQPDDAPTRHPFAFRPRGTTTAGALRAAARGAAIVAWTLPLAAAQAAALRLPGRAPAILPRLFWRGFARILGLRVRVLGSAPAPGRPMVFVANHSSWLDIPVLGAALEAAFVAKDEVSGWPVAGAVARVGGTVFVSRRRATAGAERAAMAERLGAGRALILFLEGTTSDGSRVMPFRSAFLSLADAEAAPLIVPVSVAYDRLADLPVGRAARPVLACFGDTGIGEHFRRLAEHRRAGASVLVHPPIDAAAHPNRKALTQAVWQAVADGAAELRQGRIPASRIPASRTPATPPPPTPPRTPDPPPPPSNPDGSAAP